MNKQKNSPRPKGQAPTGRKSQKPAPKRAGRKQALRSELTVRSADAPQTRQATAQDEAIGAQIRHYRRVRGINQDVLGDAIGVRFQQIQKYERGKSRIPAATLLALAAALDVNVLELFGGQTGGRATGRDVLGVEDARILQLLHMLPNMRPAVIMMLETSYEQKAASAPPAAPEPTDTAQERAAQSAKAPAAKARGKTPAKARKPANPTKSAGRSTANARKAMKAKPKKAPSKAGSSKAHQGK
jgi:transcriptional regulator with XRE-family HTH domain